MAAEAPVAPLDPPIRSWTPGRQFSLAAYWFSTNFLWAAMLTVLLPTEVLRFVPAARAPAAVGLLTAAGAATALLVHPLAGVLSDRTAFAHALARRVPWLHGRRRPYFLAGALASLVALFAMAFVTGYTPLVIAFVVLELASNVTLAPYQALIPDLVPEERRGTASGYMGLMSMLGTIFSLGLAAIFVHPGITRPFYIWLIAAVAIGAGVTLWKVPERDAPAAKSPFWVPFRDHADFWWVFLTRALIMLAFYTVLAFLEYYLKDVLGLKNYVLATTEVSGITVLVAAVLALRAGSLSDRLDRRALVSGAGLLMGLVAAAFALTRSFSVVLAFAVVFGLGYGAYTSVDWALAVDVLPGGGNSAAKDFGIWSISITLPQVVAPAIGGLLVTIFNAASPNLGYRLVFGLTFLYALAGSLLIWKVKRR
ncbi:MAG TPA: MFS transporter [Bacillota bacterium]|nr:MFS transporter [Bacillota bacterium]